MSLCRRSSGSWVVKYKDAASGQWRQRQFKERNDAEEFDAAAKMAAEKDRPLTVMEAVLAYLGSRRLAMNTLFGFHYLVNGHDRRNGVHRTGPAEHLAERYVHTLNRQDLESVRQRCAADGISVKTTNDYVAKLQSAFNWCASEDLIPENPWAKYRAIPGGRRAHWSGTLDDLRRVYPLLPEWMRWAVKTAVALCLRPGVAELFALTWAAFDWRGRAVEIYMPKVRRTKVVYPPESYLAEAWERFGRTGASPSARVCTSLRGLPVQSSTYGKAWRIACRKAGVSMPFYAIRHIAASEMLANGADLAAVSAQLGHRDLTTTGAFYAHALPRAQRRAAETLPVADLVGIDGEKHMEIGLQGR